MKKNKVTTNAGAILLGILLIAVILADDIAQALAFNVVNSDGYITIVNGTNATTDTTIGVNFNTSKISTGNTTGTGTTNYLAKWSNTTNIQSSTLYDNGSQINISVNTYINSINNKTFVMGDNKSNNSFPINVNTGSFSVDTSINSKFFIWDGDNTNTHGAFGAARSGAAANFFGITSGGTVNAPTALTQGQSAFEILAAAYDGTNYGRPAFITLAIDSSYNTTRNSTPGMVVFQTSPYPTNSPVTRMVVRQNGTVGIGTSSPVRLVHIQGNTSLSNENVLRLQDAEVCDIDPDSAGLTVTCSSDSNIKENIQTITNETKNRTIQRILELPLKEYTMKKEAEIIVGVIAQELQQTNPDMVKTITVNKEEYYPDQDSLTIKQRISETTQQLAVTQPTTWEIIYIIQQQEQKITELENRIQQLEATIKV